MYQTAKSFILRLNHNVLDALVAKQKETKSTGVFELYEASVQETLVADALAATIRDSKPEYDAKNLEAFQEIPNGEELVGKITEAVSVQVAQVLRATYGKAVRRRRAYTKMLDAVEQFQAALVEAMDSTDL